MTPLHPAASRARSTVSPRRQRALDRVSGRLTGSLRFIVPLVTVALAKVGGAILLFHLLKPHVSETFWMGKRDEWGLAGHRTRWPFLFLGWDSGLYLGIALQGYQGRSYAFFPGYPLSIRVINVIIGDASVSAVLLPLVFGVVWIPVFQAVAERYMSPRAALRCTLVTAFFPYVFLFTTVAYSESLFLFASVAAWHLYQRDRVLEANLLAAVAAVTRAMGILIALPMLLDIVRRREYKRLPYTALSPAALSAWLGYCHVNAGDWLAPLSAQREWGWTPWIVKAVSGWDIAGTALIILVALAILYGRRVDWRLTVYSAGYFSVILFASQGSAFRFLSFIFSLWITSTAQASRWLEGARRAFRHSDTLIVVLCAAFLPVALLLWGDFLAGEWVA